VQSLQTEAIILRRTNYGEADRILNVLTPQHGKLSLIAKGVRKPKSKLAGSLELLSVADLTVSTGSKEIGLVTSARLVKFYDRILQDYDRTVLAYELMKQVNRVTATVAEAEFYYLLRDSFEYLNNPGIDQRLIALWFRLKLAGLLGCGLNLAADAAGNNLTQHEAYNFDFDERAFVAHPNGQFTADHIKLLRLAGARDPLVLARIGGIGDVVGDCVWLADNLTS